MIRRDGLPPVTATIHPSSILRADDDASRKAEFEHFVADLKGTATSTKAA